jgi:porin
MMALSPSRRVKQLTAVTLCLAIAVTSTSSHCADAIYENLEIGDPLRSGLTGSFFTDNPSVNKFLDEAGISIGLTQTMDAYGNPVGGIKKGAAYDGLFNLELEFDLSKKLGLSNTKFHIEGTVTQGQNLSANYVGSIFPSSSIADQYHVASLVDAWLERTFFDNALTLRGGQMVAQNIFATSESASLFINATFAYPFIFAVNLPQDGATFVDAAPGVLARVNASQNLIWQTAVFNALPSGLNGSGNRYGIEFPLGNGTMTWSELIYTPVVDTNTDTIPYVYKVGSWYNSTSLNPRESIINGQTFATPSSADASVNGTYSIYLSVDNEIWRAGATPNKNVRGFLRTASNPNVNHNFMTAYVDAGLRFSGFVPHRSHDVFGIAAAWGNLSPSFSNQVSQYNQYYSQNAPIPTAESVIEITYLSPIEKWWSAQPFLQYIINPGGGTANPNVPNQRISNATVIGLRVAVSF